MHRCLRRAYGDCVVELAQPEHVCRDIGGELVEDDGRVFGVPVRLDIFEFGVPPPVTATEARNLQGRCLMSARDMALVGTVQLHVSVENGWSGRTSSRSSLSGSVRNGLSCVNLRRSVYA